MGSRSRFNEDWPRNNRMEIDLADFVAAKQERNKLFRTEYSSRLHTKRGKRSPYYSNGNPNLAEVKTIMIGVRNPKTDSMTGTICFQISRSVGQRVATDRLR